MKALIADPSAHLSIKDLLPATDRILRQRIESPLQTSRFPSVSSKNNPKAMLAAPFRCRHKLAAQQYTPQKALDCRPDDAWLFDSKTGADSKSC